MTSYPCRTASQWAHRHEIEAEYQRLAKKAIEVNGWAWDMQGVMHWEQACATIEHKVRSKLRKGYARVYTFK